MRTDNVNGDIWNEVLNNLEYDPKVSTQEDKIRRRAIASLALVSRLLSDCALDALWNQMESLQPIAHVINSRASSTEDVILTYVEESHWVSVSPHARGMLLMPHGTKELRKSLDSSIRFRVRDYLRRIRFLSFDCVERREASLWIVLAGWMGQMGPLLPNLQRLEVWSSIEDDHINYLAFLVPTTLNSVATTQNIGSPTRGYSSLYKLLASRGCSLESINHLEKRSYELLPVFMSFTGLRTLILQWPEDPMSQKSTVPLPELLQSFPYLTKLQLDLRMIPIPNTSNPPSPQHHALQTLCIKGHSEELVALLLSAEFPSLQSLQLDMWLRENESWNLLCDIAGSRFSALSSFMLCALDDACPLLVLQDLTQLLSRRLTTFALAFVTHKLTSESLGTMITAWPDLRFLSLSRFRGPSFDVVALQLLSRVPTLRQLYIRLDFRSLARPFEADIVTPPKSYLEELHIDEPDWFPSTLEEKLMIAQNILALFPRLRIVASEKEGRDVQDLAAIIKTINKTVATLSFRR